jgi:hypothetical protein
MAVKSPKHIVETTSAVAYFYFVFVWMFHLYCTTLLAPLLLGALPSLRGTPAGAQSELPSCFAERWETGVCPTPLRVMCFFFNCWFAFSFPFHALIHVHACACVWVSCIE